MKVIPHDGECHSVYETEIGVDRQGHPLVCSNDGGCYSKMHILRAAATHYPLLTKLMRLVYSAVNSHKCVQNIDNALSAGNYHTLMDITELIDFEALLAMRSNPRISSAQILLTLNWYSLV